MVAMREETVNDFTLANVRASMPSTDAPVFSTEVEDYALGIEGEVGCGGIEEHVQWDEGQHQSEALSPLIEGMGLHDHSEGVPCLPDNGLSVDGMDTDLQAAALLASSTFASSGHDRVTPLSSLGTVTDDDQSRLWKFILCLVAFLDLRFHLPQRACNLILDVLQIVFNGLGALQEADKLPKDARTVFKAVGLTDFFDVHVMCPSRHRVYPQRTATDTCCDGCGTHLFHPKATYLRDFDGSRARTTAYTDKPKLKLPVRLVSHQLRELLESGDTEIACDAWRTDVHVHGVLKSVMDG
jgi:hypothetical protein